MLKEASPLLNDAASASTRTALLHKLPHDSRLVLGSTWLIALLLNIIGMLPSTTIGSVHSQPSWLLNDAMCTSLLGAPCELNVYDVLWLIYSFSADWLRYICILVSLVWPFAILVCLLLLAVLPMTSARRAGALRFLGVFTVWSFLHLALFLALDVVLMDQRNLPNGHSGLHHVLGQFKALCTLLGKDDCVGSEGIGLQVQLGDGVVIFALATNLAIVLTTILDLHETPIDQVVSIGCGSSGSGASPSASAALATSASAEQSEGPRTLLSRQPKWGAAALTLCVCNAALILLSFTGTVLSPTKLNLEIGDGGMVVEDAVPGLLRRHSWSVALFLGQLYRDSGFHGFLMILSIVGQGLVCGLLQIGAIAYLFLRPSMVVPHYWLRVARILFSFYVDPIWFFALLFYYAVSSSIVGIEFGPAIWSLGVLFVTMPAMHIVGHAACERAHVSLLTAAPTSTASSHPT